MLFNDIPVTNPDLVIRGQSKNFVIVFLLWPKLINLGWYRFEFYVREIYEMFGSIDNLIVIEATIVRKLNLLIMELLLIGVFLVIFVLLGILNLDEVSEALSSSILLFVVFAILFAYSSVKITIDSSCFVSCNTLLPNTSFRLGVDEIYQVNVKDFSLFKRLNVTKGLSSYSVYSFLFSKEEFTSIERWLKKGAKPCSDSC